MCGLHEYTRRILSGGERELGVCLVLMVICCGYLGMAIGTSVGWVGFLRLVMV